MSDLRELVALLEAAETTCPECGRPVGEMVYLCPHAVENADALAALSPVLARAVLAAEALLREIDRDHGTKSSGASSAEALRQALDAVRAEMGESDGA